MTLHLLPDSTSAPDARRRSARAARRLLAVAGALLVLVAAVTPAVVIGAVDGPSTAPAGTVGPGGDPSTTLQVDEGADDDNVTVSPHADPDAVSTDSDHEFYESIRGYVAAILAGWVGESVVHLDNGDYERARDLVGDDYDDLVDRYVEVTGGDVDQFLQTREDQQAFIDAVESFEETQADYREARRVGDVERARVLARNLTLTADEVEVLVPRLTEGYASFEEETGIDFRNRTETVERIGDELGETGDRVREQEFVPTTTRVTDSSVTGSFSSPVRIDGVLSLEDGTPVANETVEFAVGTSVLATETDANGSFSIDYRPVVVPAGPGNVSVEYVPAATSIHLGSNGTAAVDVAPVTPTVTVDEVPRWVAYGDEVPVSGRVTVDGVPVEGLPVAVALEGQRLAVATTGENGRFVSVLVVPGSVATGRRLVNASLPGPGFALDPVSATAGVDVTTSQTAVALTATPAGVDAIRIGGRVSTLLGVPVDGVAVSVRVDGADVGALTTGEDGTFARTVPVSDDSDGVVTVTAVFAGGPNLNPSEGTTTVEITTTADGVSSSLDPVVSDRASALLSALGIDTDSAVGARIGAVLTAALSVPPVVWLVAFVALVAGSVLLSRRLRARRSRVGAGPDDAPDADDEPDVPADVAPTPPVEWSLALARERLVDGGYGPAIEAAYRAARGHVAAAIDVPNRGTHREFLATVVRRRGHDAADATATGQDDGTDPRAGADPDSLADLRDLTDSYERAVYGPWMPTEVEARSALADAEEVLRDGTGDASAD